MQNMDYMNIDQPLDVPDTPDRLSSQRRINSAVGDNSENGDLSDKVVLNGLVGNHRLSADSGNNAMAYSSHQRDLDVHDQFKSGISIFASASDNVAISDGSKKSTRLADRGFKKPGTNYFAQTQCTESVLDQKKIPLYIPSSSHWSSGHTDRVKLGSGSSDITKMSVSDVKIQDGNRGKKVYYSQKFPSNSLNPTRSGDTRKVFPGQGSSNSRKGQFAEIPQRAFTIQDDDHVMDVDAVSEHTREPESTCSFGTSKNHVPKEMGLGLSLSGVSVRDTQGRSCNSEGFLSCFNGANSSEVYSNSHKREIDGTLNGTGMKMNPVPKFNVGNKGKEIDLCSDSQPKSEQAASVPLQTVISPRKTGQRRLVRNGCISPFNIAKSKSSTDNYYKNVSKNRQDVNVEVACGNRSDGFSSCQIHIISPGSEDTQIHRTRGKEVMVDTLQTNEYVAGKRSSSRCLPTPSSSFRIFEYPDLLTPKEENFDSRDGNSNDFRSAEEIGGWRSTRNRSKKIYMPSSRDIGFSSKRNNSDCTSYDRNHESGMEDTDQVMVVNDGLENDLIALEDPVSFQHDVPNPRKVQASSSIMSELDPENDRKRGKQKLMKRLRKSTSARNNLGECSTSTSDDPEVSCLLSSGQPPNSKPARSRNSHRRGILGPVIEVDELCSPEIRCSNPQGTRNHESNARARQVEADEILARQLQEQLYHELPGNGVGEIDSTMAWALQHEDNAHHFSSAESPRFLNPRVSSSGNPYRHHRSQSSQNSSARLINRVRGSSSARMAQLRRNFHGRSHVASSRGTSFQFPPNMDVEMRLEILEAMESAERLDILEALEAAVGNRNDMAMVDPLFRVQRDFNENDYEMLLALDEDNHRHGGASDNQINSLPQSTVQADNFGEACAICLETPSTGDTIRHLPCLHKFHKECIDPWLRRKTSCPICKSWIT